MKSKIELALDMAKSKSHPTNLSKEKVQTSLVAFFLLIFNYCSGAVCMVHYVCTHKKFLQKVKDSLKNRLLLTKLYSCSVHRSVFTLNLFSVWVRVLLAVHEGDIRPALSLPVRYEPLSPGENFSRQFYFRSGCTFWGKKPWSRKKKLLWQLGTLVGAPVGIALIGKNK